MTQNEAKLDPQECWRALCERDAAQDGVFWYGVLTTGVFCRPSCPARTPRRGNVRFYASPEDAQRDGLRPCLRCRPFATGSDPNTERIEALCRYMEQNAGEPLTLADLGKRAGLSPFHLQRSFRAIVGVTPKQYLDQCRMTSFRTILRRGGSGVTGAIYEAGFGSSSRLYERADTRLGMSPMQYRSGGRGVGITYAIEHTAVGVMLLAATDRGICALEFGEDADALADRLHAEYPEAHIARLDEPSPQFREWMAALKAHIDGHKPDLRLPLHVRATAFQMKVWSYLQSIPYGGVESYSEVAAAIGQPQAARAVARACASNHVALAIPCHRVIRGTGELGGYKWGLERKRVLIDRERAAVTERSSAASSR